MGAYQSKEKTKSGKRKITFLPGNSITGVQLMLACGQCFGCRLEKSRGWAIRCVHEATLKVENIFITLTYNNENLPEDGSLNKEHFPLFMKRLRKKYHPKIIRFYHCGEYGDKLGRPHYHAILFGHDFEDKIVISKKGGIPLYKSKILEELWGKGYCSIGAVTYESAAYVARYVMKKVSGEKAKEHYEKVDEETGEIKSLTPEYTTMSRRPGIASDWIEKYKKDVYPSDFITHKGRKVRPPEYYDNAFALDEELKMEEIKEKRKEYMRERSKEILPKRLKVRETVARARTRSLKRGLDENET